MLDVGPERESAHSVFVAWERLRLIYNSVLLLVVLSCLTRGTREELPSLAYLIICAFMANICFCIGPVVEGYLVFLGMQRPIVRIVVFCVGTLFACLLTAFVVSLRAMHNNF